MNKKNLQNLFSNFRLHISNPKGIEGRYYFMTAIKSSLPRLSTQVEQRPEKVAHFPGRFAG